jgi:hypothetical protein
LSAKNPIRLIRSSYVNTINILFAFENINENNLYVYCLGNPIEYLDPSGQKLPPKVAACFARCPGKCEDCPYCCRDCYFKCIKAAATYACYVAECACLASCPTDPCCVKEEE